MFPSSSITLSLSQICVYLPRFPFTVLSVSRLYNAVSRWLTALSRTLTAPSRLTIFPSDAAICSSRSSERDSCYSVSCILCLLASSTASISFTRTTVMAIPNSLKVTDRSFPWSPIGSLPLWSYLRSHQDTPKSKSTNSFLMSNKLPFQGDE